MSATTSHPCPQCGSTNFIIESGLTFCANGHEQAFGLVAEEDEADFARNRGGRVHRDSRKEKGEKGKGKGVGRVLKGKEAWELWAKAYEGVLWRATWALGKLMVVSSSDDEDGGDDAGEERWGIVRGLWALRIRDLVEKWQGIDVDGILGLSETELDSEDDAKTDEVGSDTDTATVRTKKRDKLGDKGMPKLIDTIVLIYLAQLLTRQPLSLHTLYEWVQTEAIPYIRAIRHVPKEMRDRLPPEFHRALDTTSILQPDELQLAVYRNVRLCGQQFSTELPPLNWRPMLLGWVEILALPLQVYSMVKQLNTICAFKFAYQATIETRRSALSYPETQLMALLVVAVKLLYPFDGAEVKRYPKSSSAAGLVRIDWDVWMQAKQESDAAIEQAQEDVLDPGKEMQITDEDVLNMSDVSVDAYMDWYHKTWMSERDEGEGVQKELFALFPVQPPAADDPIAKAQRRDARRRILRQERLDKVLGGLQARKVITEEDLAELDRHHEGYSARMLRPGMKYRVFKHADDLRGAAESFHVEAAQTACIDVKGLLRAVAKTEAIVDRWRLEQRRKEAFAGMGVDADAAADEMDIEPPAESEPGSSPPKQSIETDML